MRDKREMKLQGACIRIQGNKINYSGKFYVSTPSGLVSFMLVPLWVGKFHVSTPSGLVSFMLVPLWYVTCVCNIYLSIK